MEEKTKFVGKVRSGGIQAEVGIDVFEKMKIYRPVTVSYFK
jgi:hypothetical protein